MLRTFERFLIFLFILLLTYLVTVRALFMWVEYAPKQVNFVVETLLKGKIDYQNMRIQQTLLGAEVEVNNFNFSNQRIYLGFQKLKFDFNFFSPFVYNLAFGGQLQLEKGMLLRKQNKLPHPPEQAPQALPSPFSIKNILALNVASLWQKIHIQDFTFGQEGLEAFYITLHSIQSFRSEKWNQASDISLFYHHKTLARFSLRSDLKLNMLNKIQSGNYHIDTLSPVAMKELRPFISKVWLKKIPIGSTSISIKGQVLKGRMLHFTTQLYTQNLVWPYANKRLPHSLGLTLEGKFSLDSPNIDTQIGYFKLTKIRIDNHYEPKLQPIQVVLNKKGKLTFTAKLIALSPIKPILKALWTPNLPLPTLTLNDVKGQVDIYTSNIDSLSLKIPNLSWAEGKKWPGLAISNLAITKTKGKWDFKTPDPLQLQSRYLRDKPIQFKIPAKQGITFKTGEASWKTLGKQLILADDMPIYIRAKGDYSGYLETFVIMKPGTLTKVKSFLPYPLMSPVLQHWLKTALVSGDGVELTLDIKGNLKDFPFDAQNPQKGYFKAQAKINHTQLKFQPNWPMLKKFTARLLFTPYNLQISTDKAQLQNVTVHHVVVDINHLASQNIAVNIQGQANATTQAGIQLLQASPITQKIGAKNFIKNQVRINKGQLAVTLNKIWIPVYGYPDKDLLVKGTAQVTDTQLMLFKQFKIKQIKGAIHFSEKGVSSPKVTGQFLKGPIKMTMTTQHKRVGIQLKGQGQLHLKELLTGQLPWKGNMTLPMDHKSAIKMKYQVDISQLDSKLPAPFSPIFFKKRVKKIEASIIINKNLTAKVRANNWGGGDLTMDFNTLSPQIKALNFWHGDKNSPKATKGGHFFLTLKTLNADKWISAYHRYKKLMPTTETSNLLSSIKWQYSQVDIQRFIFNHNVFKNTKINWHSLKKTPQTRWQVSSPNQLEFLMVQTSLSKKTHYFVNLSLLNYQTNLNSPKNKAIKSFEQAKKQSQACLKLEPIVLPNLIFSGKNITIDNAHLNKVSFNLINKPTELVLKDLKIIINEMKGDVTGNYQYNYQKKQSQADLNLTSKSVSGLTHLLKMKPGFYGKKGSVHTQLNWQGGIRCFDKQLVEGAVQFKIKDGLIKGADSGIAQIISLVSLESMARRLELNNIDGAKAKNGLVFNEIKGDARLKQGVLTLNKMKMIAPSANAQMSGTINYIKNAMDINVDITPVIGSSLATLAAITGVASPLTSLITYLLLKNIPAINENLVTYHYKVTGTFKKLKIQDKRLGLDPIRINTNKSPQDTLQDLEQ